MADRGALGWIGWMLGAATLAVSMVGVFAVSNFPPQATDAAVTTVAQLSSMKAMPVRVTSVSPR